MWQPTYIKYTLSINWVKSTESVQSGNRIVMVTDTAIDNYSKAVLNM